MNTLLDEVQGRFLQVRSLAESHLLEFLSVFAHPSLVEELVADGGELVIPVSAEENLLSCQEGLPPPFSAAGPLVGSYLCNIMLHTFT